MIMKSAEVKTLYKFFTCLNAAVCIVIIALLALVFGFHMKNANIRTVDYDFQYGWTYPDGTEVDLMHPDRTDGEHIIEKEINSDEAECGSLCFMTRNLFFTVSVGDRVIYDFHPELKGIMGKYYGDYIHYVYLPHFTGTEKITIRYVSLLDATGTVFQDMRVQNSRDYEQNLLASNYYKFFISSTIVVFGVILVIFGFFVDTDDQHRAATTSLGAFSVILGVWTNSGTLIIQAITNDSVYTRLLDYASLMLMPIPVMIFSAGHFSAYDSKLFKFGVILPIVNFFISFGASFARIVDYHDILFLTHAIILIDMIFLVIMFVTYRKKHKTEETKENFPLPIIFAFVMQIGSGVIDMARYYFGRSMDTAQFSRVGLTIFVMIVSLYEIKQLLYLSKKDTELKVMEKLAHTDGLTNLKNRTAFERLEEELKAQDEGECIFVQFDINDLKLVNDKYGHAEGDRHINAAADIIRRSFPEGCCYRVGGDEFIAVVMGNDCEEITLKGIEKMQKLQQEYNQNEKPNVPLAVAFGWAQYDYEDGAPEIAEREADMKMYECKLSMKNGKSYR